MQLHLQSFALQKLLANTEHTTTFKDFETAGQAWLFFLPPPVDLLIRVSYWLASTQRIPGKVLLFLQKFRFIRGLKHCLFTRLAGQTCLVKQLQGR